MPFTTLQLASTGALALLGSPTDARHPLALDFHDKANRTAADVLTDLIDVDGVRVVVDRHLWDRPDILALRHDFPSGTPLHLYCAAGIHRAVYLDLRAPSPSPSLALHRVHRVGVLAEVGASWRLTGDFHLETDIHWLGASRDGKWVRTSAGWASADPVSLSVSLVWARK